MDVQEKTEKRVINLIIADESGSMSVIRDTTLAGLNETITTCQKMQEKFPTMEQRITLITFDSNHTKVIFDNIPALSTARQHATSPPRPLSCSRTRAMCCHSRSRAP